MAKQSRRPSPPPSAAAKPARVETAPPLPKPQPIPQRRTTYVEAVALYERGLELLQRHAYREAADAFDRVLKQYPDEKELHERARQYLNVCQRQTAPRESSPQTIDERLYAATQIGRAS